MESNNSNDSASTSNSEFLGKYFCKSCDVRFLSGSGLWKHNQKLHPDVAASKSRQPTLQCGLCPKLLLSQLDLCEHLSKVHLKEANIQEREFESVKDFTSWKGAEEVKGKCSFTKKDNALVSSKSGITNEYFYCHRLVLYYLTHNIDIYISLKDLLKVIFYN